ncbi:alkyldihydroxyacetonephosphate synthase [Bradymonas sediminis]|uniref:FAD-binding oxidoreductase n=2 Tax=Bradymonas sediminis TaxID=1548548 RepID=A0A2Z4FQS7_9DELT|nr:FAD-binding oxidoreductase [Bradymonas sediminis]AWV90968.1 FAD-binding oxidoreductase [Bradymonas sediminis]TDP75293.1 alkyldihydroxyacetonephosphate synthase [Bradymonas sediminis]
MTSMVMKTTPHRKETLDTTQESAKSDTISRAMRSDLARIVGPQHVLHSAPDRLAYHVDCWPRGIIRTRGGDINHHLPAAIVQPANADEIVELVRWARRTSTALVPFGAGSGVCGGAVPGNNQVVVDVKRMNRILETREDDLTVRVEAGAIGMPFEEELQRRGYTLGHFPSSIYCSSVGGWVAARGAGQFSTRYGKIEDMIASLRVVTGAGEIIDTAPNPLIAPAERRVPPVGPDLTQLFVGSEGTLGVLSEATFYMAKKPTHLHYRGFRFRSLEAALAAIRDMMQAGLKPTVARLYDAFDTLIHKSGDPLHDQDGPLNDSQGHLRSLIANAVPASLSDTLSDSLRRSASRLSNSNASEMLNRRVKQATNAVVGRVLGSPLVLNSAVDILPGNCLFIVGFEGHSPRIADEANFAYDLLKRSGIDLGEQPGLHWLNNRYNVSYKQSPMYDTGAFLDTMEVSTSWSNLHNLHRAVREALSPHVFVMAHFSHAYEHGSSIYFTFTGFGSDMEDTLKRYDRTWEAGLSAVAKAGGSVAHHHGVGQSKAGWTHYDHQGGRPAFDALKRAFDPDAIMNPGKVYA